VAIRRWRQAGHRVGLVRLRLVRPWPAAALIEALAGRRAIGVIDQNISPGLGGILFHELAGTLAAGGATPPVLRSFIGGLGGKDIGPAELDHILGVLESPAAALAPGAGPLEPELLFTRRDWDQVRNRQELAGKPAEVGP
jgi:pyruvate ferredoxin oxidoreductase alpha subunit